MISNLNIAALGLNMVLALAILVVFVIRYRKTESFSQSLLWGVLISVLSNVIINLIGSTLFPEGLKELGALPAGILNAILMSVGVIGAYVITSGFQFKKGFSDKSPVINAVAFYTIPIMNLVMQSFNYLMFSFAINKGSADQFLNETFKQADLDVLTKILAESKPFTFLERSLSYGLEIIAITVIFTLLYKAFKSDSKLNVKKLLPGIALSLVYFLASSFISLLVPSFNIAIALRFILSIGIFLYFKPQLSI